MNEVLYGDMFLYEIIKYLSPENIYDLKLINKYYNLKITYNHLKFPIINNINQRLNLIFEEHFVGFKKILKSTNSCISGSFMLQCIHNEYFRYSDIDIYVPNISNSKKDTMLSFFKSLPQCIMCRETYDRNKVPDDYESGYWNIEREKNIQTIYQITISVIKFKHIFPIYSQMNKYYKKRCKPTITIQLIYTNLERDEVQNYILDTFDIDFCKNIYWYKGTDNLIINSIDNVFQRRATNFTIHSLQRIIKYALRGYRFNNLLENIDNNPENFCSRHHCILIRAEPIDEDHTLFNIYKIKYFAIPDYDNNDDGYYHHYHHLYHSQNNDYIKCITDGYNDSNYSIINDLLLIKHFNRKSTYLKKTVNINFQRISSNSTYDIVTIFE